MGEDVIRINLCRRLNFSWIMIKCNEHSTELLLCKNVLQCGYYSGLPCLKVKIHII